MDLLLRAAKSKISFMEGAMANDGVFGAIVSTRCVASHAL